MLWVGWFGFNAGSELAADGTAGMALLVTQIAAATAAFTWMIVEWIVAKKPTAVGIATGAVAGLVAITPASGSAGPMGALIIGFASAVICYLCATSLKKALGYDDSLDVFGGSRNRRYCRRCFNRSLCCRKFGRFRIRVAFNVCTGICAN